jgi:hypothetical protein
VGVEEKLTNNAEGYISDEYQKERGARREEGSNF